MAWVTSDQVTMRKKKERGKIRSQIGVKFQGRGLPWKVARPKLGKSESCRLSALMVHHPHELSILPIEQEIGVTSSMKRENNIPQYS